MNVTVCKTDRALGQQAARCVAAKLQQALAEKKSANLLVSTGASQFTTLESLVRQDIDFSRITVYHLDEYVGLSRLHPASFCKYLKERLASKAPLQDMVYINGEENPQETISRLNSLFSGLEIDVGIIGIGENAHIAFNDPPADFDIQDAYHVVTLNDACKRQQVNEGWFPSPEAVPCQAISITCAQIMRCKSIVSPVPYKAKAKAVSDVLSAARVTNLIPATLLTTHPDFSLFLDEASASLTSPSALKAR